MRISDWSSDVCSSDLFRFALPILRRSDLASGAPAALVRRDRCGMPSARSPPRWGWKCTRAGNADVGLVAMVAAGQGLSRLPVVTAGKYPPPLARDLHRRPSECFVAA